MTHQAYPLSWPNGWPRTPPASRKPSPFFSSSHNGTYRHSSELTITEATKRLYAELERLRVRDADIIVSSNVELRLDGRPRSDQRQQQDPGVAVYFKLKGKDRVMACDRWRTVSGNIAAIAKHIEAIRGIDRWGVGNIEQAFAGYTAIAPPMQPKRAWRQVLQAGIDIETTRNGWTLQLAEAAYRRLIAARHPDKGGTHEEAAELNHAITEAREELRA